MAAEETVERLYKSAGLVHLETRLRTPEGELDLVFEDNGVLVFVEVKSRKSFSSWDSPISEKQWQRLERAAIHYMVARQAETGVQSFCRFDVALVGADGQAQIVENARSFDA